MDEKMVIENIVCLYKKYGVDDSILTQMSTEKIIKGMKGILAELDLKRICEYEEKDLKFIQKVYSVFC